MKFLSGYKTYIGFIALGLVGIAHAQGWIDDSVTKTAYAILTAWTGVAVKHAWDKRGKA